MGKRVEVAVAVIKNHRNEILLSKRPQHVHQGGLWEFPGGKIETNESAETALCRELKEEVDIEPRQWSPLITIKHDYPDKSVRLCVYEVTDFLGDPVGKEGQAIAWVPLSQLKLHNDQDQTFPLPQANDAIVSALRVPDVMAITGAFDDQADYLKRLDQVLSRGIKLIQCRLPALSVVETTTLLQSSYEACQSCNAKLVINNHFNLKSITADGIHLTSQQLKQCAERPLDSSKLVGASCHNMEELQQATTLNLDYVCLSPIKTTASHPQSASLGWEKLLQLIDETNLPVFALGGMKISDLEKVKQLGGRGIAGISEFWC